MPWKKPHRRRAVALGLACALSAAVLVPATVGVAVPATAAEPAAAAPYAGFDAVARERASVSAEARIIRLDTAGTSEFSYSNRSMEVVVDSATSTIALQTVQPDGKLDSTVDLGGVLDTVRGGLYLNDWNADNALIAVVWGTKNGTAQLVRVVSAEKRTFSSASVSVVTGGPIDVARLVALAPSGAGMLAVHREADGAYVAQRTDLALASPVGGEIVLGLPAASERTFTVDSAYGNIVSTRDGAVDVISRYAPETVYTVPVEGLGVADRVDMTAGKLAVADRDGDVAVFALDFAATHKLVTRTTVQGPVRALSLAESLHELLIVPAAGDSIERLSTDADGVRAESLPLGTLRVVPGSLDSDTWARGGVFSAAVGEHVYRYGLAEQRAVSVFRYEGKETANISQPAQRGDAMSWVFAASGTGDIGGVWEYSLDGGDHWAERGAAWESAALDAGTVTNEPAALPAPLDGVAPSVRTAVDVTRLAQTTGYSRYEAAVALPDSGYDALWRVRVSNALRSTTSEPQRIVLAGDTGGGTTPGETEGTAPRLTRHPASATATQSEPVTLRAEAAGSPAPSVAWERSTDGGASWTTIAGQTSTSLVVYGRVHEDGVRYRAVFTNGAGSATTEAAVVTVTGPAPLAVGAAPEGAVIATDGSLAYDISAYGHDWLRTVHGADVALGAPNGFVFGAGKGWVQPSSGAAQLSWDGTAVYLPYGGMNGLHLTLANPYLAVGADGRGTLTADVSWNNGGGMFGGDAVTEGPGTRRVVVASFASSAVKVDGGTATFTGTPEWSGRSYVKPGLSDSTVYPSSFPASLLDWLDDALRPWFYASGNGRDVEKPGQPVTVTFAVGTQPASGEGDAIDPVEPLDAAPTVTQRPLSVTVTAGEKATLTAAGAGRPAPAVRWQTESGEGWTDVAGATSSTFEVSGLTEGVHRYRAVFSNRAGEAVSAPASVSVVARTTPEPGTSPTPNPGESAAPTSPSVAGETPAVPVADDRLTDAARGGVTAPSEARAGGSVRVVAGPTYAGAAVNVWLHSTPTLLGSGTLDADGALSVSIPASTPAGQHRVVMVAADGSLIGWAPITVTSPAGLASSGTEMPLGALGAGTLLLVAGAALMVLRRRRSA